MGRSSSHSCSSSIDSSSYPPSLSVSSSAAAISSRPLLQRTNTDLTTDLRLGLSISTSLLHETSSSSRVDKLLNWPPIKPLLRSTLVEKGYQCRSSPTFFIKVYMEGIAIGRKLDLFAHQGYDGLIRTLGHMFKTTIHFPDINGVHSDQDYLLTYEDKEGDWMMVGDVPWEMFLTTVKRLKISRANKC